MPKPTFSLLLASATVLGSSMVGCSGAGLEHPAAMAAPPAPSVASHVEKALADKDFDTALMRAEELVAATPNDAGYRALLGRAYLANGRYASARTAFSDALTLGNRDPRTIISLSLTETGLGNARGARDLLADHISDLPAADYGLAMAMAGNPQEGVRALLEATRQPDATAQTRQNLAYALALGGAWGQARLVAGQDLTAREAEKRIGQWSQAGTEEQRVVAMIGIAPRGDDAGLPSRLALNNGATGVQVAVADPVEEPRRAPEAEPTAPQAQPVEAAEAEPVMQVAAAPVPAPVAEAAVAPDSASLAKAFASNDAASKPLISAASDSMRQAARTAFKRAATDDAKALIGRAGMSRVASVAAPAPVPAHDARASDWVVQIGAFDTDAVARDKWKRLSRSVKGLGQYREVHSEFAMNGRMFHRLAVRGFGDRSAAWATCQSLRASGQACFVRLDDTGSARMARTDVRKGQQANARKPGVGQQIAAR